MGIDLKLVFAIVSVLVAVVWGYLPYFRDIFLKKTKPHAYTWLIWTITEGTAVAGLWYGKGGWVTFAMAIVVILVFIIFLLSLRYGTRNITKGDTVILIAALLAIVVWWQLRNPLLAVAMATTIDFFGYLPSFRKTFEEPWTETPSSWAIFAFSSLLSLLALNQYNFLTLTYIVMTIIANTALFIMCLLRRKVISGSIGSG